ncbi:MAG: C-type lectin domain-containing protein [Myxococcota bacterium]|nr:C-type lectin domain-containing protein [Myxococcota bacterium]
MRRVVLVVLASAWLGGCFLQRSGAGAGDLDAAVTPSDGGRPDARPGDAGDAGEPDTGVVRRDGGGCDPEAPELCNGVDDDCDPSTADGADEPDLGAPCDDPRDVDLCPDGTRVCLGGFMVCDGDDGDQPDEVELCNGLDDDCDPSTPDGAAETTLGDACDGDDGDLCLDDRWRCEGGALMCVDDGASTAELCNGLDDDCDPSTPDGAGEPDLGVACDGPDADLCADGARVCVDGALACADDGDQPDEVELCNGLDDDCDPSTPDGAGEPTLGGPCDGGDADLCEEGAWRCDAGGMRCSDATGDSTESCNGLDDDCDGAVDEGAGCPCDRRTFGGHSYLFCGHWSEQRTWTSARDWCRGRGYELAQVDDRVEMRWIDQQLDDIAGNRRWWIGANDRGVEGTWAWTGGGAASYTNWRSGEPNDAGGEDCVHVDPESDGSDTRGGWNDAECDLEDRYVCEASP